MGVSHGCKTAGRGEQYNSIRESSELINININITVHNSQILLSKCIQENLRDLTQEWRKFMTDISQPFPVELDPSKVFAIYSIELQHPLFAALNS